MIVAFAVLVATSASCPVATQSPQFDLAHMRTIAARLPAERSAARREGLPITPSDLRTQSRVPDSQNAAILIQEIERKLRTLTESQRKDEEAASSDVLRIGPTQDQRAKARAVLGLRADELRLAEQAARRPRVDFHRKWELGPELMLPEYWVLRHLARLFASRAVFASEKSNWTVVTQSLANGLSMGHIAGEDGTLIGLLVRFACEAIVGKTAERLVLSHPESSDCLRAAVQFESANGPLPTLETSLRSEIPTGLVSAQLVREGKLQQLAEGTSGENAGDSPLTSLQTTNMKVLADASEVRLLEYWRSAFKTIRNRRGDPVGLSRALDRLSDETESHKRDPSYILNAIVVPVLSQVVMKSVGVTALRRLRATMYDLVAYRQKHGGWPASLSQLGKQPPMDPFVSKPLRYKRTPTGFVLYSVGENLKDDGGNDQKDPKTKVLLDLVIKYPLSSR